MAYIHTSFAPRAVYPHLFTRLFTRNATASLMRLFERVAELERRGQFEQAYVLIDEIDIRLREVIDLRDDAMPLPEIDDLFGDAWARIDGALQG